ncbi:MAG: histidine kinase [Bacteroidota bacterium]
MHLATPPPRLTLRGLALAAAVGVLYAVVIGLLTAQYDAVSMLFEPSAWPSLMASLLEYVLTGLWLLPVWWIAIRKLDEVAWGWRLAVHAVLAPLFVAAWYVSFALVLGALTGESLLFDIVPVDIQWMLFSKLTEYILFVSVMHAIRAVDRLRLREQQARELLVLAQERELAALRAQLNPHFLFNTLNSINATLAVDTVEARAMVVGLGDLLRYALAASERDMVPFREEAAMAEAYLAIEQHRFADRLRTRVEIEDAALNVPVPPLVVQPLLENALRHGLAPRTTGGTVTLRAFVEDSRLHIEVADDGMGLPDGLDSESLLGADASGVGLRNTDRRLRTRYGDAAGLRIESPAEGGVRVRFALPVPAGLPTTTSASTEVAA